MVTALRAMVVSSLRVLEQVCVAWRSMWLTRPLPPAHTGMKNGLLSALLGILMEILMVVRVIACMSCNHTLG